MRKMLERPWTYLVLAIGLTFIACSVSSTPRPTASVISAQQGREKVAAGALLVDVRTPEEYSSGHIEGAMNVPHTEIEERLPEFGDDKSKQIVLYCGSGRRAGLAQEVLQSHGYKSVYNAGGYSSWLSAMPK